MADARKLAVVTGASTGIGLELARCAAGDDCDLVLAADEPEIVAVGEMFRRNGSAVDIVEADLGTEAGLGELWSAIGTRKVDYLMANAGRGLGHAFLEQGFRDIEDVIRINVSGTTALLHQAVPRMREAGEGRILVTGSIAGLMPGSFQAVYNATKAYLDTLSWGIRNELKGSGVTVTCLMPGPTDTEFFERADMMDTPVGQDDSKDDPKMVARKGYDAMLAGASGVTTGFMNKVQGTLASVIPYKVLASMHRNMAEPEGRKDD